MESAVLHSIFIFLFMENDFGDHGRGLGGRMGPGGGAGGEAGDGAGALPRSEMEKYVLSR